MYLAAGPVGQGSESKLPVATVRSQEQAGAAMIKLASRTGVRIVAVFEAGKAALVLLAGLGLLSLIHKDLQAVAERIVGHMHMNPARHYPAIFIDAASRLTDANLWQLAWLALGYAVVRLVEAYGLWHNRRWAEWFALVSGGLYLPIELYEIFNHVTWIKAGVFIINLGIVLAMANELRHSKGKAVP